MLRFASPCRKPHGFHQEGRHGRKFAPAGFPSRATVESVATLEPMRPAHIKWLKCFVAILLGNALYFALSPHLPPAARHRSWEVDLGTVVDFWFCLAVYGLLEFGAFLNSRRAGERGRKN
jgi:hypothetical protein